MLLALTWYAGLEHNEYDRLLLIYLLFSWLLLALDYSPSNPFQSCHEADEDGGQQDFQVGQKTLVSQPAMKTLQYFNRMWAYMIFQSLVFSDNFFVHSSYIEKVMVCIVIIVEFGDSS